MHEDEKRRLWKNYVFSSLKEKQKIYFENQQSRKIENIGKTHRDKL